MYRASRPGQLPPASSQELHNRRRNLTQAASCRADTIPAADGGSCQTQRQPARLIPFDGGALGAAAAAKEVQQTPPITTKPTQTALQQMAHHKRHKRRSLSDEAARAAHKAQQPGGAAQRPRLYLLMDGSQQAAADPAAAAQQPQGKAEPETTASLQRINRRKGGATIQATQDGRADQTQAAPRPQKRKRSRHS